MNNDMNSEHPIRAFFANAVREKIGEEMGLTSVEGVESYLTEMLVRFMHNDGIYAIKDAMGRRVTRLTDMVAEGDIRLKADSFEREREVHRHIGDFLLFWSGLFPESLSKMAAFGTADGFVDPVGQGRMSYYVASTFDYAPHAGEAKVFRALSDRFDEYRYGMGLIRARFESFA